MIADEAPTNSPEDLGWTPQATGRAALRFAIPEGTRPSSCRSCDARIFWIKTSSGKSMPVDQDGASHFATCPNAAQHRRPR